MKSKPHGETKMSTCKVCGESLERGVPFWKYPFDKDERKVHRRDCLSRGYELREELRQQFRQKIVSAIMRQTAISAEEANQVINGFEIVEVSSEIRGLIVLFGMRFGARALEPIDPFASRLEKEMVGNLLTVRIPD